jgi:hypothetical protein
MAEGQEELGPEVPADHPAASRRLRLKDLAKFFRPTVVPTGSQQAEAILTVRDRARVLAQTIEEKCPHGPEKTLAIRKAQEAMFWANQAISHRE